MADVALEVPLPLLDLGRLLERHHARRARVQVLHEALDRAALAGRVAALEQHDDLLPRLLDPVLHLQQLDLQLLLVVLVDLRLDLVLVRVRALAKQIPDLVRVVANLREQLRGMRLRMALLDERLATVRFVFCGFRGALILRHDLTFSHQSQTSWLLSRHKQQMMPALAPGSHT